MSAPFLFVYGTLRPGFDGPMARWLRGVAHHVGPGWIEGSLYRIADYPGLVSGGPGRVRGDLFMLPDAQALLGRLDAYEECGPAFAAPQEYRRVRRMIDTLGAPVEAWVYLYGREVTNYMRIDGGDFLADPMDGVA